MSCNRFHDALHVEPVICSAWRRAGALIWIKPDRQSTSTEPPGYRGNDAGVIEGGRQRIAVRDLARLQTIADSRDA